MLPYILGGALLLLAGYGLYRLLKHLFREPDPPKFNFDSGDSDSSPPDYDPWDEDARRRERERQERLARAKAEKIKDILDGDAAELFTDLYSPQDSPQGLAQKQDRLLQIAARISDEELEVFNLASKQDWLKFNMEAKTEVSQTMYPADTIEVEPMADLSQIEFALPEQLILPEEEFYRQIAENEMLVVNFYERIVKAKLLYILLDISGSMRQVVASGIARHAWARGVIVNLLINAQRDGGKFFYREFDDHVRSLITVDTPDEMKALANELLHTGKAIGDTHIFDAVKVAVHDIRTQGGDLANAELLVITDGEDNNMEANALQQLLGDDISLHYVAIGSAGNAAGILLQRVAKTFMRFG